LRRSFKIRHPGESRDPSARLTNAEKWVPAFAGRRLKELHRVSG
jgi:hypothetical protein